MSNELLCLGVPVVVWLVLLWAYLEQREHDRVNRKSKNRHDEHLPVYSAKKKRR